MTFTMPTTVHVYDTRVPTNRGLLHFDVMAGDAATALRLAQAYVRDLGIPDAVITTEECQFCHSEPAVMFSEEQQRQLRERGGFIVRLPL
jgi:hypothetical protein